VPFLDLKAAMCTLAVFLGLVAGTLVADLRAHRNHKSITLPDAMAWSMIYIGAALVFAVYLALNEGIGDMTLFLTGYGLEKALSVDNLMVFGSVFAYFGVKPDYHHRILHFGVLGAMVSRLLFVTIGVGALALIGRPMEIVFAAFVAWSALKLAQGGEEGGEVDHSSRWYIRGVKTWLPVTSQCDGHRFFSLRRATPLFLCLIAIEVTDIMFSFDSVPTVIAVTKSPMLIYSAMVFAILGLRSLYFVLEALKQYLTHLNLAVIGILAFVAFKLAIHGIGGLDISPAVTAGVVFGMLGIAALTSWKVRGFPRNLP